MISLIFPTQGNPIAIKRTLDNTKDIVNEIIIGSVCVFKDDREIIESYKKEYNIKIIDLPFNFIFKNGFSETLNLLASHVTNEICVYLNVGEIIDNGKENILPSLSNEYNIYYIDHAQETHRWWRVFNPKEMKWSGIIHEECCIGDARPFHKAIFTFADTEKDTDNLFKSKIYNDIKELCYWQLLCSIVENNSLLQETNIGWLRFAEREYSGMKERLASKGNRYKAFEVGDLDMYIKDAMSNPEFENEKFKSNHMIEFQGSPMYLGKK